MATPAAPNLAQDQGPTLGQYLIDRLKELGVEHVFGIPGDYVLGLYKMIEQSPIKLVGMTREDSAGFAADAYARVRGLGCVCVTYGVGGLSACNSIAGAYAEKSPVVVISGSPGLGERVHHPMLHHQVKDYDTQFKIFRQLTAATAALDHPETAFSEIDRVLDVVVRTKRPVYLEIPRDQIEIRRGGPQRRPRTEPQSDPHALKEAIDEATARLTRAERPVILADVEIHRFGLLKEMLELAETTGMPIASTILGKSVLSEAHPLFAGVYEGGMGRPEVTELVESADCLLMLGCFLTDINLGIFTAKLDPSRCIDATSEHLRIGHHHYRGVRLDDFIRGLIARRMKVNRTPPPKRSDPFGGVEMGTGDSPTTSPRLFARLNRFLAESRTETTVIADIGDSLFGAMDLEMQRHTEFLGPAYYASMGFSVPAAVGAGLANPDARALVVVGDGAFQMTGMELSTIARHGLNPIVVVLNNHGYTTERLLLEGNFNDVHGWAFHRIPEVLGAGLGIEVRTMAELDAALARAKANTLGFTLLNVHVDRYDHSLALDRLSGTLSAIVHQRAEETE